MAQTGTLRDVAADAADFLSRLHSTSVEDTPSGEDERNLLDRLSNNLRYFFAGRKHADAADLAQEVILRLLNALKDGRHPELDSNEARSKFAFGIAKNVECERSRQGDIREVSIDQADPVRFSIPADDLISRDCEELIRRTAGENLARLGTKQADAVRARFLTSDEQPRFSAVAGMIGVSEQAARRLAFDGRANLLSLLRSSPDWDAIEKCRGGGRR